MLINFHFKLLLTIKKSRKFKIFKILKSTKENFNIRSNGLIEIKIESTIIQQHFIILQILLRIFIYTFLINTDFGNGGV